jgi:DNA-binding IclR family transcriptional regulator
MYLSSLEPRMLAKFLSSATLASKTDQTQTHPADLQAAIETIRQRDYSTDDQEFMDGMVAIAVPIRDNLGRLMSTLSVHAPIQRVSIADLEGNLSRLRSAASDLSEIILR